MKKLILTRWSIWIASLLLAMMPGLSAAQSYGGSYTVDGNYSEWNLDDDFHSNMYLDYSPVEEIQSKLFLHYDCEAGKLFVLVLIEPKLVGILSPDDAWIALDGISNKVLTGNDNNDGTPPDFAWVEPGYGGNPNQVRGFEGSISVSPGNHRIIAHLLVYTGSTNVESGSDREGNTDGEELNIICTEFYDVGVQKSVSDPTPELNGEVDFTITVSNYSSNTVNDVEVNDAINTSLFTLLNSNPSQGSYSSDVWLVGTLDPGESATLVLSVEVLDENESCNSVTLTGYDHFVDDSNLDNNEDEACVNPKDKDQLDIGVVKSVYNAVTTVGGTSVFTIVVTNYSQTLAATNLIISDLLDGNFTLTNITQSSGSFNPVSGEWTIAQLNPLAQATLELTVSVQGSADNLAELASLDQTDTNASNNSSLVSVSCSGSSGGNNGGVESDGSLAGNISYRNFIRSKSGRMHSMDQPQKMISFSQQLASRGIIEPASATKSDIKLAELVPETGPFNSKAFVSTPEELIYLSNAEEVFSVDYFDESSQRLGAIMAMVTDEGKVYNHTKMICDRLAGATLDLIEVVQVEGKPFILGKLVQSDGSIDYAISFISYSKDGKTIVDNRWHNEEYTTEKGSTIYNFQIWSVTPQSTINLAERLLNELSKENSIEYQNPAEPRVPTLFVESGNYHQGLLTLNLNNETGATSITIRGSLTRAEQMTREPFIFTLPISPDETHTSVDVPIGYVFDVDLSVGNSNDHTHDGLYFADGPWGRDFDSEGTVIENYQVEPNERISNENVLTLERNISAKGQTKSYFSLYRALKPGNRPVDLSSYNQIQFEAQGTGLVNLTLTKESIDSWSQQYKTNFTLQPDWNTFTIDLDQFKSAANSQILDLSDILSVVFTITGDGMNMADFEVNLKNLRFLHGSSEQNENPWNNFNLTTYPNPVSTAASVSFSLPNDDHTRLTITDMQGREVVHLLDQMMSQGDHQVQVDLDNLDQGIYLIQIIQGWMKETQRISIVK